MTPIFLVDTDPMRRRDLRALLAAVPSLVVVGEASHSLALLDQPLDAPADVLLLAVSGHVPDYLATLQRLKEESAPVKVLAILAPGHEGLVKQLFGAGAHGCVLSNVLGEELVVAVRTVAAGRRFLCSDLGLSLLRGVLAKEPSLDETKKPVPPLTRREREILHLLADGLTTSEIAGKLFTSKRTVETHRQNILEKTRTKNTAALIKLAMMQGLLD
jgi:DNA-binding NarL/FixJ family response regulator